MQCFQTHQSRHSWIYLLQIHHALHVNFWESEASSLWWSSFETKTCYKVFKKLHKTTKEVQYKQHNVHTHYSKIKFLPAWKPVPALREKWEIMFRVIGLKVEHLRWPDGGDCSLDRQGYRCDLLKFENTKDILFFGPLPRWWRGNLARVMGQMLLFKVTKIPRVKETYHEELC